MALSVYPWQDGLARDLQALRGRLPNGLLVHGPRGIGTFELLLRFARSLLCRAPGPDGEPCGRCKGCAMTAAHTHPDLRYVVSEAECAPRGLPFEPPEGAGDSRKNLYQDILIHQPRALQDMLTLTSHSGGRRVIVVYPADRLRPEAAATLLKTLEEPPGDTVFLLAADDIDRVLPTIRSRCRLLRAAPPSREEALAWLAGQGVKEPGEALALAGGMPLAAFETDPRRVLAPAARKAFEELLARGGRASPAEIIAAVPRDLQLPAAALFFSRWAWDLASVRQGGAPRYFPHRAKQLQALAAQLSAPALYRWVNAAADVSRAAGHPLSAQLAAERLLLAYQRAFEP
ncbi:MAG: DNA polymerase III subunit delta [Duodenibacillus sp.]|nr:DNA polymerase III subunit delta [Duodenibacillus sp.]